MKRPILTATLSAVLLAGAFAIGRAASNPAPASAAKQDKFYKVAELKTPQEVQDFQHNVQVLQADRQQAINLQVALKNETNTKKKQDLQKQFDAALKKLNDDNATMAKAYGFSITRDYTMQIDSASIYLRLTDEEATKLEESQKTKK